MKDDIVDEVKDFLLDKSPIKLIYKNNTILLFIKYKNNSNCKKFLKKLLKYIKKVSTDDISHNLGTIVNPYAGNVYYLYIKTRYFIDKTYQALINYFDCLGIKYE
jgi:hypothetical protein